MLGLNILAVSLKTFEFFYEPENLKNLVEELKTKVSTSLTWISTF